MKKLLALLTAAVATLTSAWAEQVYVNKLAGGTTVTAGTYGEITLDSAIKASSYTALSQFGGGEGAFTNMMNRQGGRIDTRTHTFSGWFKVDALDKMIYAAKTPATDDHVGYKLAVDADGKLQIGKVKWSNGTFPWNGNVVTTASACITADTWHHIAVAITKQGDSNNHTAIAAVFVDGVAVEMAASPATFATNLNGENCSNIYMGAGVSAAGIVVDDTAIDRAETIKAMATQASVIRPVVAEETVLVEGNTGDTMTDYQVAGNCKINKIRITPTADLPAGSKVLIQSIGIGVRNDTAACMVLSESADASKASTSKTVTQNGRTIKVNEGTQTPNWIEYHFNDIEVTVGADDVACRTRNNPADTANADVDLRLIKPATYTGMTDTQWSGSFSPIYEIKYTVKEIASTGTDYVATVSAEGTTWNVEPETFNLADTLTIQGAGEIVIEKDVPCAVSIGSGVTLETGAALTGHVTIASGAALKLTAGTISRSKVENNGKVIIAGGTEENPIVINEDGGEHTSIERVEIAENSCVKMFAKGSGNRDYDVHGVSAATSTVILDSDHDWGITYNNQRQGLIRKCKVIVKHAFWLEKNSMIDSSCDLQADAVINLGWGSENATFEIGNLSGTGSISPTGAPTLVVNQKANSNYTNLTIPKMIIKVVDGTPTLPDSWTGTVQVTNDSDTEKALYANNLGKTGSTVEIVGRYKGYLWGTSTFNPTLKIGEGAIFEISNGSSTSTSTVPALVGSGTIKATWGNTARYQFADVSNWTGTILSKASVFSTADSCDKVFVKSETADEHGYYTYTLVAKQSGPTEISDITEENVMDVVPEAIQTADAGKLATWIKGTSGITTIDGLSSINVNCFLMGVANSETPELKITAEDLAKILAAENLEAAAAALKDTYPNATVTVKDVTESICGEGTENTHLYKLELSLPTAQN